MEEIIAQIDQASAAIERIVAPLTRTNSNYALFALQRLDDAKVMLTAVTPVSEARDE